MTVCFICSREAELLAGHHCCADCHRPERCGRPECVLARSSGTPQFAPRFKKTLMDALASFGGRATTGQLSAATGYTAQQVSGSMRAAKGVRFVRDPNSKSRPVKGFWEIVSEADGESTASGTSEAVAA